MTATCETCGNAFQVPDPLRPARACSRSCRGKLAWQNRSPGTSYTKLYLPGHPLADERGAVSTHRAVLYEKLGPGSHPCHWCGAPLTWQPVGLARRRGSIRTDHLDGNPRNNDPANLVPSCNGCNVKRGKADAITDGELFIVRSGKRLRAERRTCATCGAEFLHRTNSHNLGRYCSKSCARRGQTRSDSITAEELFISMPDGSRSRAVQRYCNACGAGFLARVAIVQAGGGRFCSKSCAVRASHAKRRG
jgi:hypothetical protein